MLILRAYLEEKTEMIHLAGKFVVLVVQVFRLFFQPGYSLFSPLSRGGDFIGILPGPGGSLEERPEFPQLAGVPLWRG